MAETHDFDGLVERFRRGQGNLATLRARGTYATVDADDDADGVELGASMPFDPFPYEDDAVEEFDAPPGTGGRRDE